MGRMGMRIQRQQARQALPGEQACVRCIKHGCQLVYCPQTGEDTRRAPAALRDGLRLTSTAPTRAAAYCSRGKQATLQLGTLLTYVPATTRLAAGRGKPRSFVDSRGHNPMTCCSCLDTPEAPPIRRSWAPTPPHDPGAATEGRAITLACNLSWLPLHHPVRGLGNREPLHTLCRA